MNDRQFWDSYMSSMEDLKEEPPPEVKEQLFRRMRRERRRKRMMKGGGVGVLAFLLLGSGAFLLEPWNEADHSSKIAQDGVHIWDPSISGLEPGLIPENGQLGREWGAADEKASASAPSSEKEPKNGGAELASSKLEENSSNSSEEEDKKRSREEEALVANGSRSLEEKGNEGKGESDRASERSMDAGNEHQKLSDRDDEGGQKGEENGTKDPLEPLPERIPVASEPKDGSELDLDGGLGDMERELGSPRFFVGSDMAFNFTRLLDQKMRESFESGSLVATEGELYFDFGLTAGVRLSERTSVVGRYFMKKDVGQRYYEYLDGRYMDRGIQLSYRNYELLLEHDLVQKDLGNGFRSSISAYAGAHMAQLREAQRMGEGRTLDVSKQYKDRVYGLQGGLRLGIATKKGLDIGLMLGGAYGLNNGRSEAGSNTLTEGPTKKISVGSALSLRYHFGSRSPISR